MSQLNNIDNLKELLVFVDISLVSKTKERRENGEVFTPMGIIFDMLDELDKHYIKDHSRSIFSELDFKWFDPASGIGNFPLAVYMRLMEGLKLLISDEEERKKHIIENMLYMSELNKNNLSICRQIFGRFKLNLNEGDTLLLDVKETWNVNSFDIVLGNPPYNKGGIRSYTGKNLGARNETVWTKFVKRSFEWLKPKGYLVFITPLTWLKIRHTLHKELLRRYIIWLKIWDGSKSSNMIDGAIPISLFILKNVNNDARKKTDIISEIQSKKLTLSTTQYLNPEHNLPLAYYSIFDKLRRFIEVNYCKLEYRRKTVKSIGTKEKIPIKYTLEDNWAVDTYLIKGGVMVKKTIELHPDANKRKLIISNKSGFTGAFVDEGKLGLTGFDKYYIVGDDVNVIQKILNFKIADVISTYTKYRQSFLNIESFMFVPDIRKIGFVDITEERFYKLIGLTRSEIEQFKP